MTFRGWAEAPSTRASYGRHSFDEIGEEVCKSRYTMSYSRVQPLVHPESPMSISRSGL